MSVETNSIIITAGAQVDLVTKHFVQSAYQAFSSSLYPVFSALLTLFIITRGYLLFTDKGEMSVQDLTKVSLKISLIAFFAFNWGSFSTYVVNFFDKGVAEVAATALNANPIKIPIISGGSLVLGALQTILNETLLLGDHLIANAGMTTFSPLVHGLLIQFSGIAVVVVAFLFITIAKMSIALILSAAPIIIPMALFKRTQSHFNSAIGLLAGYSFSMIFVSLAVSIAVALVHWSIPMEIITQKAFGNLHSWVGVFICAMLGLFIIKSANDMGNRIGGSCASFDAGSAIGATMGAAFGAGRLTRTLTGTSMGAAGKTTRGFNSARRAINATGQSAGKQILKAGVSSGPFLKQALKATSASGAALKNGISAMSSGAKSIRNKLWK